MAAVVSGPSLCMGKQEAERVGGLRLLAVRGVADAARFPDSEVAASFISSGEL
jgi:hypothetical protein